MSKFVCLTLVPGAICLAAGARPLLAAPREVAAPPITSVVFAPHGESIAAVSQAGLHEYSWPGNVRELENALLKAAALSAGNTLTLDLLPPELQTRCEPARGRLSSQSGPQGMASLADMEREHVARVLQATGWHRGEACEILGVSRPRLRRMMREYDLTPPDGLPEEPDD